MSSERRKEQGLEKFLELRSLALIFNNYQHVNMVMSPEHLIVRQLCWRISPAPEIYADSALQSEPILWKLRQQLAASIARLLT